MNRQRQGGFLIGKIHHVGGRLFARMLREHHLPHRTYERVSEAMSEIFHAGFSRDEVERLERYLERILANLTAAESGSEAHGRGR